MFLCSCFISKLLREIWSMSGMNKAPMFVPVHKIKWDAALQYVFSAVHAVACCALHGDIMHLTITVSC